MPKTFPQRFWRDFERLALELVNDRWSVTPTKIWKTRENKDGGFDGGALHELAKFGDEAIIHETLMEAKLRPVSQSVGLRTFAATMVIAFNGRTNCLIVVSNGYFSKQALEEARNFDARARIRIILVDGASISAWLRPRLEQLTARYPREFLFGLLLSNPSEECTREQVIEPGGLSGMEPGARIELGRRADGSLAPCEIVLEQRKRSATLVNGEARRQLVSDIVDALAGETGCIMVIGDAGVGKSHIVQAATELVTDRLRCLGFIDLAQSSTSRQLFVTIVAQIVGIRVDDLVRDLTKSDAAPMFDHVGGNAVPAEVRDAVISVMTANRSFDDVDQLCLADYLGRISGVRSGDRRFIGFHNLNKARAETLEFLTAIVPVITSSGISVILEITDNGDAPLIGFDQWTKYVALFERTAGLGCVRVDSLDLVDAIDLVLHHLPGLGWERARYICDRVGNTPLFLRSAALWLKQREVVLERVQGVTLIEKLEDFFGGIRPQNCIAVLDRHIDMWRAEIEERIPYADLITAASLLNGRLPVAAALLLLPEGSDPDQAFDALIATGLFVTEPGLEAVRVAHSLLLERMVLTDRDHPFRRKAVARKLIDGIDQYTVPGVVRQLDLGTLLSACEEWPAAWETSHQVGDALARENQLGAAATAYTNALFAVERALESADERAPSWRVYTLLELLKVEDSRYRLGLDENLRRLAVLATAIETTPLSDERSVRLRVLYLRWRAEFTREHLDGALAIANELHATVSSARSVDPEDAGRAVAALGITLKTLEKEEQSKKTFDEGVERFPQSTVCRIERWANIAAFALRTHPAESLACFRTIINNVGDALRIDKRLHVEVDLAMAYFLMDHPTDAAAQAARAIRLADTNGIPAQAARARNILGCAHWRNGRVLEALNVFDRAALDAERSYMRRFLWRIRVNLAAAAAEYGRPAEAVANARSARDLLVRARETQWGELGAAPQHVTSRWYVALLTIGYVFARCGAFADSAALASAVPLPHFARHLAELLDGRYSSEVFDGTTARVGERIMITG